MLNTYTKVSQPQTGRCPPPPSTLGILCQLPQHSTALGLGPVFVENDMALPPRGTVPPGTNSQAKGFSSSACQHTLAAVSLRKGAVSLRQNKQMHMMGTPFLLIVIANLYCTLTIQAVLI